VERRAVSTGRDLGADTEILAGVSAGQVVITQPPGDLVDGTRVSLAD
jgi:hypothetical protein